MKNVAIFVLAALFTINAKAYSVKIGDRVISIPNPYGFVRTDDGIANRSKEDEARDKYQEEQRTIWFTQLEKGSKTSDQELLESKNKCNLIVHEKHSDISFDNEKLKELISGDYVSEDNYLEKNAIVLSDLTDCTAVILAPTKADRRINKVEVILLSSRSILVILVTNIGEVFQQNYKLDADFTAEDIAEVNKLLQTYFYDVDMATAHVIIHGELEKYLKTKVNNYDMIVVALNRLLQNKIKKTVALGGKYNLLKQPDIDDVEKLKEVVSLLDDDKIVELLDNNVEVTDSDTCIKIGKELELENIADLSLVSSKYNTSKGQGVIAVFGPKRMDYSKIMTLIGCVRDNLNNNLK